jgi:Lon protease-like protein
MIDDFDGGELKNIEITLPETLQVPIFPLNNAVFFPHTLLPLHIFEPQYRQMILEALEGDKLIGIVLLKSEVDARFGEFPDFFTIGSLGVISDFRKTEEGTYEIMLAGLTRFEILEISSSEPYQSARIKILQDPIQENIDEDFLGNRLMNQLRQLMGDDSEAMKELDLIENADFDTLINSVCSVLQVSPRHKQSLLEMESLRSRAESLIQLVKRLLADKELVISFSHLRPEDPMFN